MVLCDILFPFVQLWVWMHKILLNWRIKFWSLSSLAILLIIDNSSFAYEATLPMNEMATMFGELKTLIPICTLGYPYPFQLAWSWVSSALHSTISMSCFTLSIHLFSGLPVGLLPPRSIIIITVTAGLILVGGHTIMACTQSACIFLTLQSFHSFIHSFIHS